MHRKRMMSPPGSYDARLSTIDENTQLTATNAHHAVRPCNVLACAKPRLVARKHGSSIASSPAASLSHKLMYSATESDAEPAIFDFEP